MTWITWKHLVRGGLLCVVALMVVPGAAHARGHSSIGSHKLPTTLSSPVIAFGGRPVIPMHPFKVSIYADGRVTGEGPTPPLKSAVYLDLRAIVKLAEAEGFFSMPADITGTRPNVDNGPRFVTIVTDHGATTVTLEARGESNNFLQLYSTLMELVSAST